MVMSCAGHLAVVAVAVAMVGVWPPSALAETEPSAYIERWATGTLTTGEPFESWRIHVVIPDGDDWLVSGIDGWLTGGPTWYYDLWAGMPPNPDSFGVHPDTEFVTYWTSPHLYPNSDLLTPAFTETADGVYEPTYVHLGGWSDSTFDTNGDYVIWQGTVLNPTQGAYGSIQFDYVTKQELYVHPVTFTIPEPASAALLALGALGLLRRRLIR